MMAETMRRHMPGIKSQAQFDAVMTALEATKEILGAILDQDAAREELATTALQAALEVARKATELHGRLSEVPEGALSEAAAPFINAPAPEQSELLSQLEAITTMDQLTAWYAFTKGQRDLIKTQSLRNELLDAIRAKKNALTP